MLEIRNPQCRRLSFRLSQIRVHPFCQGSTVSVNARSNSCIGLQGGTTSTGPPLVTHLPSPVAIYLPCRRSRLFSYAFSYLPFTVVLPSHVHPTLCLALFQFDVSYAIHSNSQHVILQYQPAASQEFGRFAEIMYVVRLVASLADLADLAAAHCYFNTFTHCSALQYEWDGGGYTT